MKVVSRLHLSIAAVGLSTALVTSSASAQIDLGTAGTYAVFGLGSTMSVGSADSASLNTAEIYGNVAVGADTTNLTASGSGSFQKGFIQGSLYVDGPVTPAAYTIVNKNFTVSGTVFGTTPANPGNNPDSVGTGTFNLSPGVQDAIDRSAFYAGLPGTSLGAINLNSANLTLTAGVYSATSFLENSGAILTITGAANSSLVLNVGGDFSFTKSFIVLKGGITQDNVLFNITGSGTTVTVSGDNSLFFGTVLAVNRNITIDGLGTGSAKGVSVGPDGIPGTGDDNAGLEGRVIGALSTSATTLDLIVHSGGEVNQVPEPSSVALAFVGVFLLGLVIRRRR